MPRLEEDFSEAMEDRIHIKVDKAAFDVAKDFMRDNCTPDDIFGDDVLRKYVAASSLPEDIFEEKELGAWAEENGYEKK